MASTASGLWYPDGATPMSVIQIVKAAQESVGPRTPYPVANVTARAAYITALAALTPPVVPSTSNPVRVWRADGIAGGQLEVTTDGATWSQETYFVTGDVITPGYIAGYRDPTTSPGQPLRISRSNGIAYAEGQFENSSSITPTVNGQFQFGQLPAGWRPQFTVTRPGLVNIAGVGFGVTSIRVQATGAVSWQAYASGGPYAAGAISIAVGQISWPIYS